MKNRPKLQKKEIRDKQIANLSNAEFKTLVIKILTEIIKILREMIEYGCKIEEKVKAMKSEIKNIYREPTVKGRKPGLKSTI